MNFGARFIGGLLLLSAVGLSTAQAQYRDGDDRWERLGCSEVGRRADRDVIEVGRREGRFTALRLEAEGNDVNILDLTVIYANGEPDNIDVRREIREGERTGPLDLRGRDRAIDRIEIVSKRDFRGRGHGPAQVCIFGREARYDRHESRDDRRDDRRDYDRRDRDDRRGGHWEELGCQSVGILGDRDVIRVGRREGRFKAIKLLVSGNDVNIIDLRVIYSNGAPDDIPVRSEIREGGETRPLDLRGYERSIDRIEMIYRAKPNFQGKARVCVVGIQ
ncbi:MULTISPECIES: DUF2541 family protein [Rhodomicrobium]|uniref:DUF2541 family protein n=1 Tax=Rhodomicrobium TaxID=1068 RepID=UPI0014837C68|nr:MULTISPECIES: DUF2541 family protein [Rhodomicrobium]